MTKTQKTPGPRRPHRLYVHLAWSTLARIAAIPEGRRATIETHMLAACRQLGVEPIEARALADRVHLLVRLPSTTTVYQVASVVRRAVAERLAETGTVVRWSTGFAAITVSPAELRRVRKRLASLESASKPPARPAGRVVRPAADSARLVD